MGKIDTRQLINSAQQTYKPINKSNVGWTFIRFALLVVGILSLGSALYTLVYALSHLDTLQEPGDMGGFVYIVFPPFLFFIGALTYFVGIDAIDKGRTELRRFLKWLGGFLLLLIVILYIAFIKV